MLGRYLWPIFIRVSDVSLSWTRCWSVGTQLSN